MNVDFQSDSDLRNDQIRVVVHAAKPTGEVTRLLRGIAALEQEVSSIVSVQSGGRLEVVRKNDIVAIEIDGELLLLKIFDSDAQQYRDNASAEPVSEEPVSSPRIRTLAIKDGLAHFAKCLSKADFVRVSRQVIINLRYLQSLEISYSGNMMAKLSGGVTETVSRHYVTNLRKLLGA
ncbi:LytTR family DNA-binding domain-containing protein [Bifidobacterium sp. ESL0764]|uniref:LytTR family DNA-binding domain-containing protein n=1 Tax=Bifidobacterium sp. ESL0764 TaxID=2983228 RepID=UPI0023F6F4F0|nr:LytTR family DNA-binding domain-containing protein [Bifidobacterium sp. ESL0764]WEV65409.1 LytTR family DNA-binding domain-containing protein [Bifidobacterium sp. ESL0764]